MRPHHHETASSLVEGFQGAPYVAPGQVHRYYYPAHPDLSKKNNLRQERQSKKYRFLERHLAESRTGGYSYGTHQGKKKSQVC